MVSHPAWFQCQQTWTPRGILKNNSALHATDWKENYGWSTSVVSKHSSGNFTSIFSKLNVFRGLPTSTLLIALTLLCLWTAGQLKKRFQLLETLTRSPSWWKDSNSDSTPRSTPSRILARGRRRAIKEVCVVWQPCPTRLVAPSQLVRNSGLWTMISWEKKLPLKFLFQGKSSQNTWMMRFLRNSLNVSIM